MTAWYTLPCSICEHPIKKGAETKGVLSEWSHADKVICRGYIRADERSRFAFLLEALEFYADPATYHALDIWADPPCGDFMEDFSEDHGDEFYQRPMPGKMARAALGAFDV